MAARSLAGLTITPTGTSTSKMSCSRLAKVNADNESPPRSVNAASGATSVEAAPSSAPAARPTVSSTGRFAPSWRSVAQHVGLAVGEVDVQLLELGAVVLLELRAGQLADAGEQTVLERERPCLDEEVARDLVGLQPGLAGDALQRVAQQRLDRGDVAADAGQRVVGRDDHRQHVGAGAVAVHEDLPDRRVTAVGRLQLGDGDELALRQLEHVVAAVDVDQLVGSDLGHDVAGVVPAVGVEELGGDLGPLVVAGDDIR